jgi:hypothetical protein
MRKPTELGDFEFEIRYGGIFPHGGPLFCVRQVFSSFFPFLLLFWSNLVEPGGASSRVTTVTTPVESW